MAGSRMTEQIGRVLGGRYRLVAPIGAGTSAQVFVADDVNLRRRVAVKVLHPALAADEAFLRRFRAEARAAAALSHPNVMAVYDWGDDDEPYLVLEYLGGGSLRGLLDRGHRLSVAQALMVGLEAARALDAAHRRGFVHRDIKPANLLFGDDGRLRIADFGLARALSEAAWTEPADGGLVGTARYAAPEQGVGGTVDGRADVYALGLVLVEAVTGTVPLTADSAVGTLMRRVGNPVPVPDALGPLQPIVADACAPVPDERLDAGELARRLLEPARDLDPPAPLPLPGAVATGAGDLTTDPTLLPAGSRGADEPTVVAGSTTAVFDDELATAPEAAASVPPAAVAAGRRRRRRWPWVLLAVLLVAAAAGGAAAWFLLQTPSAEVPAVTGKPLAEARAQLAAAGVDDDVSWEVVVDGRFDDTAPVDQVLAQEPPPGTELDDGEQVRIVVSRGPPPREIPNLEGLPHDEAVAAIEQAELAVGAVAEEHHEEIPTGHVITWRAGDQDRPMTLPKGTAVDMVVSRGKGPRTVPGLAGTEVAAARAQLEGLGFEVSVVEEFSKEVEKGRVIRTDPAGGATRPFGSTVTIVASKGRDLVTVPDVEGMRFDEAQRILEEAGLSVGNVSGPIKGRVDDTDPDPGAQVDRGSEVHVDME